MEKTIHITLAETTFQLSEAAYERLDAYLSSLKAHFKTETDRDEIIRDIESRIAEKFLEKKHKMVSPEDVAAVIAEMGDASQFDDTSDEAASESNSGPAATTYRKLYRDTDRAIIGGVAAGIAAYFSIDPLFIRLLFVVSIFFGGGGIVLYVLLWLLIPEAKTASQKLEMRGDAVTLENIKDMVKDRVTETHARGTFHRVLYFPFEIVGAILRFITQSFAPFIGRIVGVLLTLAAFFGVIGLTIALGIVVTNWNAPFSDFPLRGAVHPTLLTSTFAAGYLAILIPLILVAALGVRLVRRKHILTSTVGFGLVGLWALSLIASGIFIANLVSSYYQHTMTAAEYQRTTQTLEPGAFTQIMVQQGNITLREGETQSVELNGRQMDMKNIKVEVEDGVLTISRIPEYDARICIFCRRVMPNVVITTPDIESITIESGTARFDSFMTDDLVLSVRYSHVRGELTTKDVAMTIESGNVNTKLITNSLLLDAKAAHVELEGSAETATIAIHQSSFNGEDFVAENVVLTTESSQVELNVPGDLKYTPENSSSVDIQGQRSQGATTTATSTLD